MLSLELLTDPDCAPDSAKYVSTSRTGSHARYGIVTLMPRSHNHGLDTGYSHGYDPASSVAILISP